MPDNPEKELFSIIEKYAPTVLPAFPSPNFELKIGIRWNSYIAEVVEPSARTGVGYKLVVKYKAMQDGEKVTYISSPVK